MRALARFVGLVSIVALATIALIWISQRRLIYLPTQITGDVDRVLPGAEEVTYPTEDGLTLNAWFLPAAGVGPKGTVVVFNGNAGNRSGRAPLAAGLAERGYAVLLVDYRGYGGNPGRPSETGLNTDARAAVSYLETRPDVDPELIAYFGESLGSGVAVGLADQVRPAALLLRSPFTSLEDMGATHYPFLPVSLLLWDRYPNEQRIRDLDVPTLIVAGSADSIVPTEQSRALFQAAPGPKHLVVIEGADHNDYALAAGPQLVDEVAAFLDDVLTAGRS